MEIEVMKKIIENHIGDDDEFLKRATEGDNYYRKKNDITRKKKKHDKTGWREANNKIPSNFYQILVDQKASYMFSNPPTFDVGDERINQEITDVLGESFSDKLQNLSVFTSNMWRGSMFCWIDPEDGSFQYEVVDSRKVFLIQDQSLKKKDLGVYYTYNTIDENGDEWVIYEYCDYYNIYTYRKPSDGSIDQLEVYRPSHYRKNPPDGQPDNVIAHDFPGQLPWIFTYNNTIGTTDLNSIKEMIDMYDSVLSGFFDDLEDIQQAIMLLYGHGGETLEEFRENLKMYKVLELDSYMDDDGNTHEGRLETISFEIPVEARNTLLTMTRKRIFEDGQGIDPDPENFGNSSGTALKHLYDNLDLKCGKARAGFKPGLGQLVRLICQYKGLKLPDNIKQTWYPNRPSDRAETADIVKALDGIISRETQYRLLDFIEDPLEEKERVEEEKKENDIYSGAFPVTQEVTETNEQRGVLETTVQTAGDTDL